MKSFCPSKKKCNLGGQLGDKFGEKRQIWTLKNKNLQIWALFIVLEIKQIMSNICRWYVFFQKITFPRKIYFPMQKCWKMFERVSSVVMAPPVMSARWWRAERRSSLMRSPLRFMSRAWMTLVMLSCAFSSES